MLRSPVVTSRWLSSLSLLTLPLLAAVSIRAPVEPSLFAGLKWRNIGPFRAGRVTAVTGAIGAAGCVLHGLADWRRVEDDECRRNLVPGLRRDQGRVVDRLGRGGAVGPQRRVRRNRRRQRGRRRVQVHRRRQDLAASRHGQDARDSTDARRSEESRRRDHGGAGKQSRRRWQSRRLPHHRWRQELDAHALRRLADRRGKPGVGIRSSRSRPGDHDPSRWRTRRARRWGGWQCGWRCRRKRHRSLQVNR